MRQIFNICLVPELYCIIKICYSLPWSSLIFDSDIFSHATAILRNQSFVVQSEIIGAVKNPTVGATWVSLYLQSWIRLNFSKTKTWEILTNSNEQLMHFVLCLVASDNFLDNYPSVWLLLSGGCVRIDKRWADSGELLNVYIDGFWVCGFFFSLYHGPEPNVNSLHGLPANASW